MEKGKFYAVGTGPGDADCLTLGAVRAANEADVIAVPVKSADEESTAFSILKKAVCVDEKKIIKLIFSMNRDLNKRKAERAKAAELVRAELDSGNSVVMITLGDVSVYSTAAYITKQLSDMGYETKIIPGVPSFCAGAALAGISLCEGDEALAVIPSGAEQKKIEAALDTFDNVVIMKAGSKIPELSELLKKRGLDKNTAVICSAGLDGEYIGGLDGVRSCGYFTTLIVKRGHKNGGAG